MILGVELQNVQYGLWVLSIVFLGDGAGSEKPGPLLRKAGKVPRDGIETDVDLMNKVGRSRCTEGRVVVDVVDPAIELFIVLQGLQRSYCES